MHSKSSKIDLAFVIKLKEEVWDKKIKRQKLKRTTKGLFQNSSSITRQ
jgi:hypothetical protein